MSEIDEEVREKLNNLSRELALTKTDYNDLQVRIDNIGKRIADLKIEIDNTLEGE